MSEPKTATEICTAPNETPIAVAFDTRGIMLSQGKRRIRIKWATVKRAIKYRLKGEPFVATHLVIQLTPSGILWAREGVAITFSWRQEHNLFLIANRYFSTGSTQP